ncbi:helix-turn-helix domain-containing protein [Dactylosporangium sp. NPDC051485]|uniref:helix-turn-helix domain-containing protein n=1 Tax=Dactylosporangium sp. NPDC051485 TaxID=3154846 RepID=UPI00343F65E5
MSGGSALEPLLLTVEEAGAALRLSKGTVKKLIRSGELDSVKIGASRRIPADDLAAYVKQLQRRAADASDHEDTDLSAA